MGLFAKKQEEVSAPVIDLRERMPEPAKFGFPTKCPDCNDPGFLDHIDTVRRKMHQHCPSCGSRWETTEAELIGESPTLR